MCPTDEGKVAQSDEPEKHNDSLADQALEAIIRSQELRARSRQLRKNKEASEEKAPEKKDQS